MSVGGQGGIDSTCGPSMFFGHRHQMRPQNEVLAFADGGHWGFPKSLGVVNCGQASDGSPFGEDVASGCLCFGGTDGVWWRGEVSVSVDLLDIVSRPREHPSIGLHGFDLDVQFVRCPEVVGVQEGNVASLGESQGGVTGASCPFVVWSIFDAYSGIAIGSLPRYVCCAIG